MARQTGIDLDLGIALFDLQSFYESIVQDRQAKSMMQQAVSFYNTCKADIKLYKVCDRRLADVQSLYGDYLLSTINRAKPSPISVPVSGFPVIRQQFENNRQAVR